MTDLGLSAFDSTLMPPLGPLLAASRARLEIQFPRHQSPSSVEIQSDPGEMGTYVISGNVPSASGDVPVSESK